jgi:ribose/xylose/arabinose/galactoside ABC-type transport system permease subunit
MIVACMLAIGACGVLGAFSGSMIAYFGVPSFVASLGMMMVASGLAYMISGGLSIYQIPDSFDWLGRGDSFLGIPNAVVLDDITLFGCPFSNESNHGGTICICRGRKCGGGETFRCAG